MRHPSYLPPNANPTTCGQVTGRAQNRNRPEGLLRLEPGHSASIALEFSDCDANARKRNRVSLDDINFLLRHVIATARQARS